MKTKFSVMLTLLLALVVQISFAQNKNVSGTVSDENGCESTSEIYLVEPQQLEIFLSQDVLPAYCNNNNPGFNTGWAQVSAQGGTPNQNDNYDFVWSIDGQTDQDVLYSTIESVNSGTYSVTVVDDRLCADQIDVVVGVEPTWQSYTSSTPASCYGSNDGSVSIQMEGGCGDPDNSCDFTYLWQGGAATGNNLSDVPGLLRNPEDPKTLLSSLPVDQVDSLKIEGVISKGMLPKVNSAVDALNSGVNRVHFIDGRLPHSILLEIFTDEGIGTEIIHSS